MKTIKILLVIDIILFTVTMTILFLAIVRAKDLFDGRKQPLQKVYTPINPRGL